MSKVIIGALIGVAVIGTIITMCTGGSEPDSPPVKSAIKDKPIDQGLNTNGEAPKPDEPANGKVSEEKKNKEEKVVADEEVPADFMGRVKAKARKAFTVVAAQKKAVNIGATVALAVVAAILVYYLCFRVVPNLPAPPAPTPAPPAPTPASLSETIMSYIKWFWKKASDYFSELSKPEPVKDQV